MDRYNVKITYRVDTHKFFKWVSHSLLVLDLHPKTRVAASKFMVRMAINYVKFNYDRDKAVIDTQKTRYGVLCHLNGKSYLSKKEPRVHQLNKKHSYDLVAKLIKANLAYLDEAECLVLSCPSEFVIETEVQVHYSHCSLKNNSVNYWIKRAKENNSTVTAEKQSVLNELYRRLKKHTRIDDLAGTFAKNSQIESDFAKFIIIDLLENDRAASKKATEESGYTTGTDYE